MENGLRRQVAHRWGIVLNKFRRKISDWHKSKLDALTDIHAASGQRILTESTWDSPYFGTISLADGHWDHPEDFPRTLAWQKHQLQFLPDLIAFDRYNGSEKGGEEALSTVLQWWDIFKDSPRDKTNPPWSDHATARRLSNILLLRSHIWPVRNEVLDKICQEHAAVLKREDFYVRGNNHGFDQSIFLFEYAHEMRDTDAMTLARDRIQFEISNAFVSDGCHIENSPGYQNFGIIQLKHADDISLAYTKNSFGSNGIRERAELVLAHMTRPDGLLPHIGDTADFKAKRLPVPPSNDLVSSDAGWCFFRSGWDSRSLQGVFKSGYLSVGHRHDDDLALSLFALGEEWLIDGGMFAHQPTDPRRIYVRSAAAHSLPFVVGLQAVRDINTVGPHSRIVSSNSDDDVFEVTAETQMWRGFTATRSITFNRAEKSLVVRDIIEPIPGPSKTRIETRISQGYATYGTRFLVPADKTVSRASGGVLIKGERGTLRIETNAQCKIVSGQSEPDLRGWRSRTLNKIEPAFDISFLVKTPILDEVFRLSWV